MHSEMPSIQHYQIPPQLQPQNATDLEAKRDDIVRHLRDRNYSNQDIFAKLDELSIDLGGGGDQGVLPGHRLGSRWS